MYLNNLSNNRRIAKNTIFLYFRTILIMLVSLYTSRVVLNELGIEDFGIYNAVGGFVLMFSVLTGALSNAISRFITFGIGKSDKSYIEKVFCTSINILFLLSIIILILCELAGVWFLNNRMNIPIDRMTGAHWVLQCSLITFIINLLSIPYNACIIAYEHMQAFAYISILDAILKLSVVFILPLFGQDKLIVYSILLVFVALIVRLAYSFYCSKHFTECKYKYIYDKEVFRELFSFSGWNFLTNAVSILNSQGVNILMNLYFGVIINSARGIASQVEGAIWQFVSSFTTAINPQITKCYAKNELARMNSLICTGTKFSFFLLLLFVMPILCETQFLLGVWLKNIPDLTVLFVQLSIIGLLINSLGNPGYIACMATGNIKMYAIWISMVGSLAFFLTWGAYSLGYCPESAYWIYISVYIFVLFTRLVIMRDIIKFPIKTFLREVLFRVILVFFLSLILPFVVIMHIEPSIYRCILSILASSVSCCLMIYLVGFNTRERWLINSKVAVFWKKVLIKIK